MNVARVGNAFYSAASNTLEMPWKILYPLRAENDIHMNDTKPHYHSGQSHYNSLHPDIDINVHDIDSYTSDPRLGIWRYSAAYMINRGSKHYNVCASKRTKKRGKAENIYASKPNRTRRG